MYALSTPLMSPAHFAASVRLVCTAVPTFVNLANLNLHPGLTHIPTSTSRKFPLTKRWSASAKLSLGSHLFQCCILQELQRTHTMITQNHVNILVDHYPATMRQGSEKLRCYYTKRFNNIIIERCVSAVYHGSMSY
jgi:hypothetical protein